MEITSSTCYSFESWKSNVLIPNKRHGSSVFICIYISRRIRNILPNLVISNDFSDPPPCTVRISSLPRMREHEIQATKMQKCVKKFDTDAINIFLEFVFDISFPSF